MKSVKNLMISTAILASLVILFVIAAFPAVSNAGPFPQVREVPFPYLTIQEAINAADDGDTVLVHPGTYTGAGNRDLDFNGLAITVRSEDPDDQGIVAATIIDCNGTASDPHRAFIFQSGEDANSVLAGFTIINAYIRTDGVDGAAPGDDGTDGENGKGGAINCTGSSPVIRNCVISNCVAEGGWGGNGIDSTDGVDYDPGDPCAVPPIPPTMPTDGGDGGGGGDAGQAYGGAIYCGPYSGPIIYNCDISNCRAIAGNAGSGGNGGNGGAGDPGATPPVPDASDGFDGVPGSFDADGCGGGIYVASGSTAAVSNCTVSNCSVSGGGGGLSCGGGIYYGMGYSGAVIVVDVNDCLAEYGAGIYCDTDCLLTISGTGILNNTATADGAGIYCEPNCDISISGTDILNNTATADGAGIYCDSDGMLTLDDCNVSQNTAIADGAGIYYVAGDALMLNNCDIRDNNSVGGDGAGIWYDHGGRLSLNNCDLSGNTADTGVGGGIYGGDFTVVLGATVVINSSTVSRNTAVYGGGICLVETDLTINDCNVSDNTAEYGGGVYWLNSKASINNCTVSGNSALVATYCSGGGFYCLDSSAIIKDCLMADNVAQGFGGAMFFSGPYLTGGAQEITNCLVTNNTAGLGGGGISVNWHAEPNIVNCTIADNMVTGVGFGIGYGGGLYCSYDSYTNIINSIIWNNVTTGHGWQVAVGSGDKHDPRPSTVDIYCSDIGPTETPPEEPNLIPGDVLTVTTTGDANTLVDEILGAGIRVSNLSYTGSAVASGTFDGGIAAGIGVESGIILTCGDANLALPPNISDYATWINNLPGDADLDALIPGYTTNDATILEFDFVTEGGDLFFNFVFASEEYNEFVYSLFNDVFGFFLDGVNIALIPGTTIPVSVDNVNGGNPFGTNANYPEFFNNNDLDDGGPFFDIEYDGFTSVFTAQALGLSPGIHHIKLAVADAGDYVLDSAVFIQTGSFAGVRIFKPPIYVEDGCTLNGWDWNPDSNSWDPNFTDSHNINADPCFTDGYHLSQTETGEVANSPCIDVGSESAEALGLHMMYTTRADDVPDANIVDMGYHYRLPHVPCDLDFDDDIDLVDLGILLSYWLQEDCNLLGDCEGADLDLDTDVDFSDYAIWAKDYEPVDKTPPEPDPSTWAVEPYAVPESSDSISMTATTALDEDESGVEYRFVCISGGGRSSGWQDSSTYIDTWLIRNVTYTYKVQTRDKSPNKNKSAWSVEASAYIDLRPPTPNPSQWEIPPYEYCDSNDGSYHNRMVAVTAQDISGVEYYFWCRTLGYESGWQDSPIYNVKILEGSNMRYVYKVKTRDKSTHQNETGYSELAVARQ